MRTEQLIGLLKQEGYQREFKEELFDMAVKKIRISLDHEINFCLKNGLVLTERKEAVRMQWHTPIGYKVLNGKIVVYEEHRKIVEQIFRDYDSGISALRIAKDLKIEA